LDVGIAGEGIAGGGEEVGDVEVVEAEFAEGIAVVLLVEFSTRLRM
jgi:hypothetical protein